MAEIAEGGAPHNPAPVPTPTPDGSDKVVLSKEEHAELKRIADASSQNFERLKAEREKREAAERELETLKGNSVPSSFDDDKVGQLADDVAEMKRKEAKREVIDAHPELKDLWSEFETFREQPDNKGMNMKTAAKSFLIEKGLMQAPRKGLENPTGGDRTPIASGMSADEVKRLRETDYKKYSEMLRKGQITVA